MLLFLTICLLFLIFCALVFNNGDPLEPTCLSFEMYFISTFVALLNAERWGVTLSVNTFLTIISGLLVFAVASMLTNIIMNSNKKYVSNVKRTQYLPEKPIDLKWSTVLFISAYCIWVGIIVFKATFKIAVSINVESTISNFLAAVRSAYIFTDASIGTFNAILSFSILGIAYVFSFIIVHNFVYFGRKSIKLIYFVPCIIYLMTGTLGSGRTFLIKWIVTIVTILVLLIYKKYNLREISVNKIFKIIVSCCIAIVLFYGGFQVLGIFTQKTGELGTWDMISIYTGSSIPALDKAIINIKPDDRFWGEESFYGLYGLLNKFGFNIPNGILHLPFVYFENGYSTNVYTSLRTYIYDFGYTGMYVIQFLLGIGFRASYNKIRYSTSNYLWMIIYGMFNYGLVMQGIEDIFMRMFLSITQIFSIVFIFIFYKLFVEQKIKIRM